MLCQRNHLLIDLCLCPDIHAGCRLVKHKYLKITHHPATDYNLLLVASGQFSYQLLLTGTHNIQRLSDIFKKCTLPSPVYQPSLRPKTRGRQRKILTDIHLSYDPFVSPVFRNKRDSFLTRLKR